jgi:hypothetical protein
MFIRKYDDQGKFVHLAGRNQLGSEIDKLNEELSSFGARFGVIASHKDPVLAFTAISDEPFG